jgi:polysaccharide export outer membrane protein
MAIIKKYIIYPFCIMILFSCCTPKNYNYLEDLHNGEILSTQKNGIIKLAPYDKISIIVKSKNPEISNLFNNSIVQDVSSGYTSGIQYLTGYTINQDGNIEFPVLGAIRIAGLTKNEAEQLIKEKLISNGMLKDALITIEYMNLSYSVLGEVASPGQKQINKDVTNIFEALGTAGDIDIYGKRDSVMIIRNENDQKKVYILNLNSAKDVYSSDAYYIHQNDLIYVKSNDVKIRQRTVNGNNTRNLSFWASVVSVITTIAVLIFK